MAQNDIKRGQKSLIKFVNSSPHLPVRYFRLVVISYLSLHKSLNINLDILPDSLPWHRLLLVHPLEPLGFAGAFP